MGRGFKSSRQRQYIKGLQSGGAGGEIPKWPKGADCKSAGERLRRFKSSSPHHLWAGFYLIEIERAGRTGGNSSAVERQPSKLGVAGSNPVSRSTVPHSVSHKDVQVAGLSAGVRGERRRVDRLRAHVAQSAERVLGKDEVSGSSPDMGSIFIERIRDVLVVGSPAQSVTAS